MTTPISLSELASYTSRNGNEVKPGCYGVSHGSGMLGELIRHATGSWAGHAFVYIGNGQIVEGTAPVARVASADSHPDAVWNIHELLTDAQRLAIVARAQALVGTPYDYVSYIGFALEILKIRAKGQLDDVFRQDHWRVCSALVADCYWHATPSIKFDVGQHAANLVSPADELNRILSQS
jgi:hypothetical protein